MRSRAVAYATLVAGGVLALVASAQSGGLSRALALAGLAGALLMLALRARGRRVIGGALALLGLGILAAGVTAALAAPDRWPIGYAVAGILVAIGGVVTVLTSPRWPSRAERFENSDEPVDLWRAQDAGLDPTADPVDPDDPDVRKTAVRDRMS
ncbi:MAG TPA: Trp biosynthesis-associated membrane protein [Propionibacteriaceae bacterium]|nr:Trp biosynthesis-associated membrane protein [Propionibacteriaceae bacterium]